MTETTWLSTALDPDCGPGTYVGMGAEALIFGEVLAVKRWQSLTQCVGGWGVGGDVKQLAKICCNVWLKWGERLLALQRTCIPYCVYSVFNFLAT